MGSTRVGDLARFGIEWSLEPDPDPAGPPDARASWGRVAVWVGGRNLTRGLTAASTSAQAAEVPLLPLVRWIVGAWDPLLHEERLPTRRGATSSADWYISCLDRLPSDEAKVERLLELREAWWHRHGLGSALPGFRIPDIHLRRAGNRVEVSWTDSEWRTVSGGVTVTEQPGVALVPVAEAAGVLSGFARGVAKALAADPDSASAAHELLGALDELGAPERQLGRLELAAGIRLDRAARSIASLAGLPTSKLGDVVRSLLGLDEAGGGRTFALLTTPVLLYRSASPALSASDVGKLLELTHQLDGAPSVEFGKARDPDPCVGNLEELTSDGYERALAFRTALGLPDSASLTGPHDLESVLLPGLGVEVRDVLLDDRHTEGAAVHQPGAQPIIAVNTGGRFSSTPWGRRMTLAHELCHLLHDADDRGLVGVTSNPWASYALERRANAFAAMLLAPEAAVATCLGPNPDRWRRADLVDAMRALGVGITTLTWQLHNLGWISDATRQAWLEEFASASSAPSRPRWS